MKFPELGKNMVVAEEAGFSRCKPSKDFEVLVSFAPENDNTNDNIMPRTRTGYSHAGVLRTVRQDQMIW